MIRISPTHNAVWAYAEWCCDHKRPWPKMAVMAADLARDVRCVRVAFEDLQNWGVLSTREDTKHARIVRLGDGRETPSLHRNAEKERC